MSYSMLFSIFDRKAKIFLPPFCARNSDDAQRMMVQLLNRGKSNFSEFPEDYELFRLGEWFEEEGTFHTKNDPEKIVNFRSLVTITNPNPEASNG